MGLEHVLGNYEYFLNDEDASIYTGDSGVETYKETIDFVLSPEEINEFLQKAKDFNFGQHRYSETTGMYATKLVQNSIDAENNVFELITVPFKMDCFGFGLKLKHGEPVFIDVHGNLGNSCFTGSEGCFIDVHGSVKDQFARCAKDGQYRVTGNAGYGAGGYSERCTYEFGANVLRGFDCAKGNEFRAFTPEGLKTLKKYVPSGNSIYDLTQHKINKVTRLRDRFPFLEHFMRRH